MKASTVKHALLSLNWVGHVELPDRDIQWLADGLAAILSPDDAFRCGICGDFKDITVSTKLGRICEDCISEISDTAEEQREELED